MATDPVTEFSTEIPGAPVVGVPGERPAAGISPSRLAWRRLKRNRVALVFGAIFIVLVLAALAAPIWANDVAHTSPSRNHIADNVVVDGKSRPVVDFDGVPIGPTWGKKFFLGADRNGRDVMVRLLYGARNSLFIGVMASAITTFLAVVLGLLAGYYRGFTDAVISRVLDILWAFPVLLLGIALGVSLVSGGLKIGPLKIEGDSLWIPTLIIGVVNVVYLARPIRGQALSLREKEFVEAARAQGASNARIMFSELLPNVASTVLVFFPILVANSILLEAALSFLGAGVQSPNPSWGTMISDGINLIISAPHLTIVPGIMLVMTVLSLNIFGEGVRDALDPRAKVRIEH
jgi:peptide/nickel transport system permease protein